MQYWQWLCSGFLYNGYWVFPGGKVQLGRAADPSPPSSAEVKTRAIPLLSLRAFVAYERVKPTYAVDDIFLAIPNLNNIYLISFLL